MSVEHVVSYGAVVAQGWELEDQVNATSFGCVMVEMVHAIASSMVWVS